MHQHSPPHGTAAGHYEASWPGTYDQFPQGGALAPAIVDHLVEVAPSGHFSAVTGPPPMPAEPITWVLVKHLCLAAFALMAVMVALQAATTPVMAATYAGTAFLLIVTFICADRMRFLAHDSAAHELAPLPASASPEFSWPADARILQAPSAYAPQLPYQPAHQPPPPEPFQVTVT